MQIAIALGIVGATLVIGGGVACFQWGAWKTRTYISSLKEKQQREAMEKLTAPAKRGAELLSEL